MPGIRSLKGGRGTLQIKSLRKALSRVGNAMLFVILIPFIGYLFSQKPIFLSLCSSLLICYVLILVILLATIRNVGNRTQKVEKSISHLDSSRLIERSDLDPRLREYQQFIDALVKIRPAVEARWATGKGWPKQPKNATINQLLSHLSSNEKDALAQIIQQARDGGIHDVLAYLQDQINLAGLRLARNEIELAIQPYGTEMYYDWVCRGEGDDWPSHQLKDEYESEEQET